MTKLLDEVARAILKSEYDQSKTNGGPDVSDQFDGSELVHEFWGPHYRGVARAAIAEFCRYLREPSDDLHATVWQELAGVACDGDPHESATKELLRAIATHMDGEGK